MKDRSIFLLFSFLCVWRIVYHNSFIPIFYSYLYMYLPLVLRSYQQYHSPDIRTASTQI